MYVCMYVYIYIYIYTYARRCKRLDGASLGPPHRRLRPRRGHGCIGGVSSPSSREFKDEVFEDVVFDNNRFYLILYLDVT